MTRDAIVAEAQSWLGTPYHHLGRRKGVGTDCVGIVLGVLAACGTHVQPNRWVYNRRAEDGDLDLEMGQVLQRVPLAEAGPGDVATFWIRPRERRVQHCGILTPHGLLHTHSGVGKVVEHRLDVRWQERMSSVYRLPGVTE